MRIAWPVLAVCLLSSITCLAQTTRPGDEKVLLTFEPAEMDQLAKKLDVDKTQEKIKDGPAVTVYRHKGANSVLACYLFPGKGVAGSQALGIGKPRKPGPEYYIYGDQVLTPPEAVDYYGIFQDNYSASSGLLFNTCGPFRQMFPTDWSGYDVLRFDAFAADVEQTVRVSLEDEQIGPPATRNVVVPGGRWTTVEVDFKAAARDRGLDPARMATLAITVVDAKGEAKLPYSMFVDNLRLSSRTAKTASPIARDDSPQTLPDYFRHTSKPVAEKLPIKPDLTPLGPQKPFTIVTDQPCGVMPVGWAAAFDNTHLLVGFCRGTDAFTLQSLDGGATWRGLDGGVKPTVIPVPYSDHQCGHGDVVGQRADVFLFTNLGCRGVVQSAMRLFTRRLLFTEKGWVAQPKHALVDADLRHCNSNQSVFRGPDGRTWAGYGIYGRLGNLCVNVRYSDDDGVTWKSSREGTSGVVPGTIRSNKDGWGFGYTVEEPCIVPMESGVACLWYERKGYDFATLKCSRFDGKAWATPTTLPEPKERIFNPTRPPIYAVSLGGKEIFVTSSVWKGLLHFADGQWKMELPDLPQGARLSVAGGKTVVIVAAVYESPRKGPVTLRCWQRGADGKWSEPADLAREEAALASIEPQYEIRVGYTMQPYAPANFVPLAWSCEGQKWVKYLRVPVPLKPAGP